MSRKIDQSKRGCITDREEVFFNLRSAINSEAGIVLSWFFIFGDFDALIKDA